MTQFIYMMVTEISKVHDWIMTWNDTSGAYLNDKQLHFLTLGVFGMLLLFIIHPIFKALSKNHIFIVSSFYVFTVMLTVSFAIEIGQGFTGTGTMEMDDVKAGVAGFLFLFAIFALIRFAVLGIAGIIKEKRESRSGRRNSY